MGYGAELAQAMGAAGNRPPRTPDGRYIFVDGVLWRASNPALSDAERERFVAELMHARRGIGVAKCAGDRAAEKAARAAVHAAKLGLGERGPGWWDDGASDVTRRRMEGAQ